MVIVKRSFIILLLICCLLLHLGNTSFRYKIYHRQKGSGRLLKKAPVSVFSIEDCAVLCVIESWCLAATFADKPDGKWCGLYSTLNVHMTTVCDDLALFTHMEIDVTKGAFGCHGGRDDVTQQLKCICSRQWNAIQCQTIDTCPLSLGYTYKQKRCFKYSPEAKDRINAAHACFEEGGHLFTLESDQDITLLLDGATSLGVSSTSTTMSWIDGGEKPESTWNCKSLPWTAWTPGTGSCVSLSHGDELMKWFGCKTKVGYFCEVDVSP